MAAAFLGYQAPKIATRGAPLAIAGMVAGFGKAVLLAVPAVLDGAAISYGLLKAFDVRRDEFGRRAADGDRPWGDFGHLEHNIFTWGRSSR